MKPILPVLFALCAVLCLAGCNLDDREDDLERGRKRVPAEGLGAITFENDSLADWNLEIDGLQVGRVSDGHYRVGDYAPGTYLVHLDQHNGSKEYDRNVTVVEGLVTVVRVSGLPGDFDVDVFTPQR